MPDPEQAFLLGLPLSQRIPHVGVEPAKRTPFNTTQNGVSTQLMHPLFGWFSGLRASFEAPSDRLLPPQFQAPFGKFFANLVETRHTKILALHEILASPASNVADRLKPQFARALPGTH